MIKKADPGKTKEQTKRTDPEKKKKIIIKRTDPVAEMADNDEWVLFILWQENGYYIIGDEKNKMEKLYLYRLYYEYYRMLFSLPIGLLPREEGNKSIFTKVNILNSINTILL